MSNVAGSSKNLRWMITVLLSISLLSLFMFITHTHRDDKSFKITNERLYKKHRSSYQISNKWINGTISRISNNTDAVKNTVHVRRIGNTNNSPEIYNLSSLCQEDNKPVCPLNIPLYKSIIYYKSKINIRKCYISPLLDINKHEYTRDKYVVFMLDGNGDRGWNNIRMAAETVIVFAYITGRTLVMPYATQFRFLNKNNNSNSDQSSLYTYFNMDILSKSVKIISMDQFIQDIAIKRSLLKYNITNTEYLNIMKYNASLLWHYIEKSCHLREWRPGKYFMTFNISRINNNVIYGDVDTSGSNKRLHVFSSHNRKIINYNKKMDDEIAIYFPGDNRDKYRILTHFYTYLYIENQQYEKQVKYFVKNKLHYHNSIFCYASEIIRFIHYDARMVHTNQYNTKTSLLKLTYSTIQKYHSTNNNHHVYKNMTTIINKMEAYISYHIRRGDFLKAFPESVLDIETIYNNTNHLLDQRVRLIYISTDERNYSKFDIFIQNNYTLRFFHDYAHKIPSTQHMNKNYIPMIEQIICANAFIFFGTALSSFTGYITRLRGYYNDIRYNHTFYYDREYMHQLFQQKDIIGPFWAREFASAHENIDDD